MKIKKFLSVIIIALSTSQQAYSFGMDWVYDPTAVAKAIQQLAQMKQQYDLAKQQYESMTGKRSTSFSAQDLLNFQNMFPQQYSDAMDYGFGDSENIASNNMIYGVDNLGFSKESIDKVVFENQRKSLGREQAHWKKAYEESKTNFKTVGGLIDEISVSKDMKTSVDLTAKSAAATALLVAEQNRLFSLSQMNEAEQRKLEQQGKEESMRETQNTTSWGRYSPVSYTGRSNDGYYSESGEFIPQ
jgi:type IV secretion system protein VirB5